MSNFLKCFKKLVREGSYDNTYKMAWAKSIVEISSQYVDSKDDDVVLSLYDLSNLIIKYYWNQTIFFNLVQGSKPGNPPLVFQYTKDLINLYQEKTKNYSPVVFERVEAYLEKNLNKEYQSIIKKSVSALKLNVAYRFLNYESMVYDNIYSYEKNDNTLVIKRDNLLELNANMEDLFDLINYRWSLILETFNSSPRINKKVRIMEDRDVKRSNLKVFDKYLSLENPERKCFICGEEIDDKNLSRDHVIPWSYLYSDDIWNIVFVHKTCNSTKNNLIPDEIKIEKLKERNNRLKFLLEEQHKSNKVFEELSLAIDKDYVDKFYIGCKG